MNRLVSLAGGPKHVGKQVVYSQTTNTSSNIAALACNKSAITSLRYTARVLLQLQFVFSNHCGNFKNIQNFDFAAQSTRSNRIMEITCTQKNRFINRMIEGGINIGIRMIFWSNDHFYRYLPFKILLSYFKSMRKLPSQFLDLQYNSHSEPSRSI